MGYRDSQRFRKVYGYYRPLPRATDTSLTAAQEYVDDVVAGIDWKQSVRVASTLNVNLTSPGSIDSIALADEDRVLLKNQTATAENGIYIYYSSTGALTRTKDAEQDTLTSGAAVYVEEGTENNGTAWILSTPDPITVGTTSQTWVIFSTIYPVFVKSGSYARSTVNVSFGSEYTDEIGSDVFFYVSGTIGTTASPQIGVFGGDVFTSGSLTVKEGLSGSLTKLSDGTSYIIAGDNIAISSASNGSITITGFASGTSYFNSTAVGSIFTTGSTAFVGGEAGIDSPEDKGTNVFFYVSGSINGESSYDKRALFGGDVVISGSLRQGQLTSASGRYSHAEGNDTTASGLYSHAEGRTTTASGDGSHAQGFLTEAVESYSLAAGIGTIASGSGQNVFGKYNTRGNTTSLLVVGNGSGTNNANRSDVLRVEMSGLQVTGSLGMKGSVTPDEDRLYDLGTPAKRWANVYTGDLHLRNDRGDYTLIEEEEFLSIRFNKTGRRYKFVLERVPELDDNLE